MNISASLLYETDFYGWIQQQAHTLRTRNLSALDFDNLIEEIESMGKSEQRELASRLEILLMHLLKWQFQPNLRSVSWKLTIIEQRNRIIDHLSKNPSIKSKVPEVFTDAYKYAVLAAAKETGMKRSVFPSLCSWSFAQIMDETFWPQEVDDDNLD